MNKEYYDLTTDEQKQLDKVMDYELRSCIHYNLYSEIDLFDIEEVVLELTGRNEEYDWHWICRLKDDKYVYISGGCDYTGWDCQSNGDIEFADTLKEALLLVPQDQRRIFEEMLEQKEKIRENE